MITVGTQLTEVVLHGAFILVSVRASDAAECKELGREEGSVSLALIYEGGEDICLGPTFGAMKTLLPFFL